MTDNRKIRNAPAPITLATMKDCRCANGGGLLHERGIGCVKADTFEEQVERFLTQYKGCNGHAGSCHGLPCDEKMQAFLKWVAKGERA